MAIDFNIEITMRDKVGEYYFSRSDPDDSCRCGTGMGSGLHFDLILEKISGARKQTGRENERRDRSHPDQV